MQAPAIAPGVTASLPRAQKQVDEGGGPRTSQLFLTNVGSAGGHFTVTFYSANGNAVYTRDVAGLPASGTAALDLATFDGLPAGTYGVRASGDQPLTLSELTTYTTPPADHFVATYGERSAAPGQSLAQPAATPDGLLMQYLPRLAKTNEAYTVFSIRNSSLYAADAEIEYHDLAGNLIPSEFFSLPPNSSRRFDLRQVAALPAGFIGSAVVVSDWFAGYSRRSILCTLRTARQQPNQPCASRRSVPRHAGSIHGQRYRHTALQLFLDRGRATRRK